MQVETDEPEITHRVAALDVGKAEVVCCARLPGPRGQRMPELRTTSTMTAALLALGDRLAGLGVSRVVMEATSDVNRPGIDGGSGVPPVSRSRITGFRGHPSSREGRMGRRGDPAEFRRKVLDLVESGRSPTWRRRWASVIRRSTAGAGTTASTRASSRG